MKRLVLIFAALLSPAATVAAEAPSFPVANAADYVVTMVMKRSWGPPSDGTQTVIHHGEWTRVDNGNLSTAYFGNTGPTTIRIVRRGPGEYFGLGIVNGLEAHRGVGWARGLGWNYDSFRTGERQVLLGEQCDVWNVARYRDSQATKLSCVTDDGIELWQKLTTDVGTRSGEATHIERRTVQPSEVRPPSDLLDLKSWITPAGQSGTAVPAAGTPGDFETVLKTEGSAPGGSITRTMRRHYPWTYAEDLFADGRRTLSIENKADPLRIEFEGNATGEFTWLRIDKMGRHGSEPVKLNRHDTASGELCTWFDMWPKMPNAGLLQCRTQDGIVLKEEQARDGRVTQTLEAVQLQRRDIGLAEVLPPDDILSRAKWGIPE